VCGWFTPDLLAEGARVSAHLAGKVSSQLAHRLVGLDLLRDLGEREGPPLLAGGSSLGIAEAEKLSIGHAEAEKLSIGHVAADGCGQRASVLPGHVGRRHDLQDAGVLQQRDHVASDVNRADRGPTRTDRVEDDQRVEMERRHLEERKLLVREGRVRVGEEAMAGHRFFLSPLQSTPLVTAVCL
jgi:hypothetical protein